MHIGEQTPTTGHPKAKPIAQDAARISTTWRRIRGVGWRGDPAHRDRSGDARVAYFPGIDLVRAFAVISIVVFQAIDSFGWQGFSTSNPLAAWFRIGWLGLDLSFVVSGFVVTLGALRLMDREPTSFTRTFWARRFARIVPLHYATCLLFVVLAAPSLLLSRRLWAHALAHLGFFHNLIPQTHGSINGPNWSVGVAMQFSLLVALFLPRLRGVRPVAVLAACIGAAWAWRAGSFALLQGRTFRGTNLTWFAVWQLPGVLDDLGFGIALALLIHSDMTGRLMRALRATRWLWPPAAALSAAVMVHFYWQDPSYWGNWRLVVMWRTLAGLTGALLVVSACAICDGWLLAATAPLRHLGTISYGIYLWHMLVITALKPVFANNPAQGCFWTLGLTLLLASLSWHFFEKPLMGRLGRLGEGASEPGGLAEWSGRIAGALTTALGRAPRALPESARLAVRSAGSFLLERGAPPLFVLLAALPMIRRINHPTLLGDDFTRVVDLITHSFHKHLFLPFSEHVAPLFQLVSWLTWQIIGHDIRLAPLGYCVASVLPWGLVMGLLGTWLGRETGSRTAAVLAVALVSQSPLVLEAAWFYSASSFLWAVAGILLAVLGASWLAERPRRALVWIGLGCALGPAGTTLGLLAAPLAILRAGLEPRAARGMRSLAALIAIGGLAGYVQICKWGGIRVLDSGRINLFEKIDLVGGLGYALTVPGRLLWPAVLGVPGTRTANPMPAVWAWGLGLAALCGTAGLAAWPRARWDRRLILVGAAMIYLCYGLTFSSRTIMIKRGLWTEAQMLYFFGGRYHVLPLLGLAAIGTAVLASWPAVRRCDARRGRPAAAGIGLGLLMMIVQKDESDHWTWMLRQPDQRGTLAVVRRVDELARAEGIPRAQLLRAVDPSCRGWNRSLLHDRPNAFPPLSWTVLAPDHATHPRTDEEVRELLRARLSVNERLFLGAGACASLNPGRPAPEARTLAIARRVAVHQAREFQPGRYRLEGWPAYIEYEVDPAPGARYLLLPGLYADQDVIISWCEGSSPWRARRHLRWLESTRTEGAAVIDLQRLIHWSGGPISRLRVEFSGPGQLALQGPPRLLR